MKIIKILIIFVVLIIAANIAYSFQTNSSNYKQSPLIVSSGGEIINSSNYKSYTSTGVIIGITNSSTYKNLLGFFYGWLLADGQPCTANNQCEGRYCCSNECSSSTCSTDDDEDTSGAASGGGGGGGAAGGGGGGFFVRTNESLEGVLSIKPESIKTKIILGETSKEKLTLTNMVGETITISLRGENLGDYLSLSENIIKLEFGETKEIELGFIGKKVGAFVGQIIATITGFGKSIPIIVEIISEIVLFDVKLDIIEDIVGPGDELKTQITLLNIAAPEKVDVIAAYFIKDLRGNIIYEESETFAVEKQVSYPKAFKIPDQVEPGSYVAIIEVRYADSFAVSSQLFRVSEKGSFIELKNIAKNTTTMFILAFILIGFSLLLISVRLLRKGKKKK
tara:strand:+ start:1691 stop:2872 length:1182 start_codon:yes stop_codon:yes gene_type:complete